MDATPPDSYTTPTYLPPQLPRLEFYRMLGQEELYSTLTDSAYYFSAVPSDIRRMLLDFVETYPLWFDAQDVASIPLASVPGPLDVQAIALLSISAGWKSTTCGVALTLYDKSWRCTIAYANKLACLTAQDLGTAVRTAVESVPAATRQAVVFYLYVSMLGPQANADAIRSAVAPFGLGPVKMIVDMSDMRSSGLTDPPKMLERACASFRQLLKAGGVSVSTLVPRDARRQLADELTAATAIGYHDNDGAPLWVLAADTVVEAVITCHYLKILCFDMHIRPTLFHVNH